MIFEYGHANLELSLNWKNTQNKLKYFRNHGRRKSFCMKKMWEAHYFYSGATLFLIFLLSYQSTFFHTKILTKVSFQLMSNSALSFSILSKWRATFFASTVYEGSNQQPRGNCKYRWDRANTGSWTHNHQIYIILNWEVLGNINYMQSKKSYLT